MSNQSTQYDAVVIGSGFGGSISALRLAQAGKSVLVLERGKRYQPGEFPRDVTDVNRLFWRYPKHKDSQGLYDIRFFSSVAAVVASGVGGGSLVYANIHIRPDAVILDIEMPQMDGVNAAMAIRNALGSETPTLIAVSGHLDMARLARVNSAFDHALPKPVQVHDLVRLLNSA